MAARKRSDPPGDAEKPEGIPAARDGSPDEDELARRRAAKGTSVNERVQNGDGDDDQPELFKMGSLEGDPKVTLKNLIKAGSTVTVKASLSSAEVPIKGGGLFDPEEEVTLLVRALPGGVTPRPKHAGQKGDPHRPVREWTLSQAIAVTYVQEAGEMFTREQVLEMLHEAGVASATVSKLLGEDPQPGARAGA